MEPSEQSPQPDEVSESERTRRRNINLGYGMTAGILLGVVVGALTGNVAIWIAIGVALGLGLGSAVDFESLLGRRPKG